MAQMKEGKVDAETTAAKLPDGVVLLDGVPEQSQPGCRVFVHYNGPTDMLSGMCTGMALLEPGAVLIDPIRPTPFERFFFREPVNGYIFEMIDQDRANHFDQ